MTIGDLNPGSPTDTLTVQLSDLNASLVEGASYSGPLSLVSDGSGEYTLGGTAAADTAANVTAALDALTLNAPATLTGAVNGVEALNFTLSDTSSAYAPAPATASLTADILAPNFTKTFGYSGNIQSFTVQTSGTYDIAADGAEGGGGAGGAAGGLGATASGDVYLQAGATLEIVVGGAGQTAPYGGGGGGGSFVIETKTSSGSGGVDVNEVIAGAGGIGGAAGQGGKSGGGGGGENFGGGGGGFTGGAGGVPGQSGSVAGVNTATFLGGSPGSNGGGGGFGGGGAAAAFMAAAAAAVMAAAAAAAISAAAATAAAAAAGRWMSRLTASCRRPMRTAATARSPSRS